MSGYNFSMHYIYHETLIGAALLAMSFNLSWASEESCEVVRSFVIENKAVSFCLNEKLKAWVSLSCITHGSGPTCDATELLALAKKRAMRLLQEDLEGGKNPGSVICSKLKGQIVIARTQARGGEVTFCRAKDASLIDCNSLGSAFYSAKKVGN